MSSTSTSLKQQHYRRLMKEQKAKSLSEKKKIVHPLAKYNAVGQLSCVVCTIPVKTELLWTTHVQSRKHKDNVAAVKKQPPATSTTTATSTTATKRKPPQQGVDDEPNHTPKKVRFAERSSALPPNFFDSGVTTMKTASSAPSQLPASVPVDFFDKKPKAKTEVKLHTQEKTLPKAQSNKTDTATATATAADPSLPEGFFDDPKKDAKARKVEYKDPELQEWEKFQKSIQKEDDFSDALILERDVEANEEREEDEVQEQASCFLRVEKLRQKQEALPIVDTLTGTSQEVEGDSEGTGSDSDELDLDQLLDWRAKVS